WVTVRTCGALAIMPRIVGVSSWVATSSRFLRPSALTVASWRGLRRMRLPVSVILSFLLGTRGLLYQIAVAAAPPRGVQILRSLDPLQRIDGGLEHVVGIVGPQRLGQDVLHAGRLQHRTHRAARNDARALHGGLEEHPARAEVPHDLAGDRRVLE